MRAASVLSAPKPPVGRGLWEPIRGAVRQQGLPVHSFVVEHEPGFVNQAWELELQQPADLVHLSKPRLPAVVFELDMAVKRLCHGLPEPRELMGPLWTRLAVDLAQRFDELFVMTPLAAARGLSLPREPGSERPGTLNAKSVPQELQP